MTDDAGWGAGFRRLAAAGVDVLNLSAGGRSSKSYADEGWWRKVIEANLTSAFVLSQAEILPEAFRLPMAIDNRPLTFDEWNARRQQTVFVSATPSDWELTESGGEVVEQVIRPTGLVDPLIHVVAARGQVPHLVAEIKKRAEQSERGQDDDIRERPAHALRFHWLPFAASPRSGAMMV